MTQNRVLQHHALQHYARPQVRCVLQHAGQTLLGSEIGLHALQGQALVDLPAWRGRPVQCLAAGHGRRLLLIEDEHGQVLHECDDQWQPSAQLPALAGEKIKSLALAADAVLAGTKSGLFRLTEGGWQRLFGDPQGYGEVLWVQAHDAGQPLRASVKKLGYAARPALIESSDAGASWSVTPQADYQDLVIAADAQWIVTRWRGARRRSHPGEIKKHPLSAAALHADGWSVLDGDKLETQRDSRAASSFYHPALAEAERLCFVDDGRALVAGVQGAHLVDAADGSVTDLFAGRELPAGLGKLKRVFVLDDGVLLATATFGSFRSTDDGRSWEPAASEWSVLDAEHLVQSADGRWWLGCQRALFVSADNGKTWRYVKLKVKHPHYCELRGGLAITAGRLYVGTKAGLLSSRLDRPEDVSWVPGYEHLAIEALQATPDPDTLLVGTGDGRLWRHAVARGQAEVLAQVPVHESALVGDAAHCLIATADRLYECQGGQVRDVTPAATHGGLALVAAGSGRFLAWDRNRAWLGRLGQGLRELPGWPAGVRHAALGAHATRAHTTDRRQFRQLALPSW
jgi:photosystem II stability/assembly factor-like uncharacterized protein